MSDTLTWQGTGTGTAVRGQALALFGRTMGYARQIVPGRSRGFAARSRVGRDWRPGRHFGRRMTRIAPPPRPPVPLYALGTVARIERIRLMYSGGVAAPTMTPMFPASHDGRGRMVNLR